LKRMVLVFIALSFFLLSHGNAFALNQNETLVLTLGSNQALVNGNTLELATPPVVDKDTTIVPLRFISETFGASVEWLPETREITVQHDEMLVTMQPDNTNAVVNGDAQTLQIAPSIIDGVTMVPLRFLAENMRYGVNFNPESKEIHIKQLPPPNNPPVADFTISKITVAQGETVTYQDKSFDPDGDAIMEAKWAGNEKVFFAPGVHEISLAVKDHNGDWSKPCVKTITVTEEVLMDRLTYTFLNSSRGEPMDITEFDILEMKVSEPFLTRQSRKILISNSPEKILGEGVLYQDTLSGENRLFYHHINGTNEAKKLYLVATNQGANDVKLRMEKWGAAGPADPMAVGRSAAYRYLDFDPANEKVIYVKPGEKVILNEGINNTINPGQTIHGIFDVQSFGSLQFSVVAVSSSKQLADMSSMEVLPPDGTHIRGTFSTTQRFMYTQIEGDKPERLVIADGKDDAFFYGWDKSSDSQGLHNRGNYGIVYKLSITSKQRVGVFFSPRGGVFAGAASWGNNTFYLPNQGVLQPKDGSFIGVINAGEKEYFTFIPPAGSSLPVNLMFIPF